MGAVVFWTVAGLANASAQEGGRSRQPGGKNRIAPVSDETPVAKSAPLRYESGQR